MSGKSASSNAADAHASRRHRVHTPLGCEWALARAHAKSGDAAMISGYLGKSSYFDDAVSRFAHAYAEQNARDHRLLLEAIRHGRIEVFRE